MLSFGVIARRTAGACNLINVVLQHCHQYYPRNFRHPATATPSSPASFVHFKPLVVQPPAPITREQARALNAELQTGIANPLLGDAGLPRNSDQDEVTYDFLTGDDWDDVAELGFAGGRPSGRPAASEPLRSTKGSALGSLLSRWFGCSCCGLEGKKKVCLCMRVCSTNEEGTRTVYFCIDKYSSSLCVSAVLTSALQKSKVYLMIRFTDE